MKLKALRAGVGLALSVAALTAALPAVTWGALTCNGIVTIDYVSGPNFALPGDVVRVRLTLGTGSIDGGSTLTIQRLKFDLDCDASFALGLPCTDEGLKVEYEGDGTVSNTCGKVFTSGHAVSAAPNEVVLTPNTPIVIPANKAVPPGFCVVEFNLKVLSVPSTDVTPGFYEEVGGYTNLDAMCDNAILASGGMQSSAIPLCPTCTGTECTMSACNQDTGQCVSTNKDDSTPCSDTDQNLCTTPGCEQGQCVQAHQTTPCPPDNNACTNDLGCNPGTGLCEYPPVPDSSPCPDSDANLCTQAGCEMGQCVQTHMQTPCPPDNNECTDDLACDPATGMCPHPNKPNSTPCTDTDHNLCTTAGCEMGQCVQTHQTTTCPPDSNECTQDLPCNPATGMCDHPNKPDSTPCTDTDNNDCTAAGCESGQCRQSHIPVCVTPDHFQCYEIKPKAFVSITGVPVEDQFGQHSETIRLPHRLCAPADKNDEPPNDAFTHPDHLIGHRVSGPNVKVANLEVTNQFGIIKLDIVKPDVLMVPTLKTLALPGPAGPPTDPNVPDHFQCYKAKRSKGSPKFQKILGVKVKDQFGTVMLDLLKPVRLCAPANKRNEDPTAPQHRFHLLCYKTKNSAFGTVQTFTNSQFGPAQPLLIHRRELCVPSTKNTGSSTTTTTPVTTTTSSTGPITTTTTSSTSSTVTTTTTSSTTTTSPYGLPSRAFLDEPVDLLD
jgi:hypothetical protein